VWIARRRSAVELGRAPCPARLEDLAPVALSTAFIGAVCLVVEFLA
jgi:hypothetical protein